MSNIVNDEIVPTYLVDGVTRTRRAVGTLTKAERQEYVKLYNRAYKLKLKQEKYKVYNVQPYRKCQKCDNQTALKSYFYCHNHLKNIKKIA